MRCGLVERIAPIEYAFLDAEHSEEATIEHFDALLPHLADGAVVVLDDITQAAEMRQAWSAVCAREQVSLARSACGGSGWSGSGRPKTRHGPARPDPGEIGARRRGAPRADAHWVRAGRAAARALRAGARRAKSLAVAVDLQRLGVVVIRGLLGRAPTRRAMAVPDSATIPTAVATWAATTRAPTLGPRSNPARTKRAYEDGWESTRRSPRTRLKRAAPRP